ncbi:MAG: DUF4902 domain-containing protein [Candidatus Sedimenticola sp. (ex Thyasira tokunagai)]
MINLSDDGYVRLSSSLLQTREFKHHFSGLDDEANGLAKHQYEELSEIYGYTEWVSSTNPIISVGWDWRLTIIDRRICYERVSAISSNLMLVGDNGDLGSKQTEILLEGVMDTSGWQRVVEDYFSDIYHYKE